MASSRSSWAASSSGESGVMAAPVSAWLRQSAVPISRDRGRASEAKSTLPIAASRFSSTIASALTSAALPVEDWP
eukprot:1729418-Pleurochrysis_carterae.AAC.1